MLSHDYYALSYAYHKTVLPIAHNIGALFGPITFSALFGPITTTVCSYTLRSTPTLAD